MAKRKKQIMRRFGRFIRQYQRKRYPHIDPNDRSYDQKTEREIKKLPPEELDQLLHGDYADEDPTEQ